MSSDSSAGKESTCNAGDPGSIPGLERSAGEGIGYPLQYFGVGSVRAQGGDQGENQGDGALGGRGSRGEFAASSRELRNSLSCSVPPTVGETVTPGESGLVSRGSQGLRSPLESRRGSLGAP